MQRDSFLQIVICLFSYICSNVYRNKLSSFNLLQRANQLRSRIVCYDILSVKIKRSKGLKATFHPALDHLSIAGVLPIRFASLLGSWWLVLAFFPVGLILLV